MKRQVFLGVLLALGGCVTVAAPEGETLGGAPAYEELAAAAVPTLDPQPFVGPFLGVELEEALAGSLESMEFLGGLRVATVAAGSPAEAAGIRIGDRVVRATKDGSALALERTDQWSALLAQTKPGDELRLEVERDGGLVDVTVRAAAREAGARAGARRFVERRKARCIVETELVAMPGGGTASAARLVELAPSSPLRAAGLAEGTRLLAMDDVPLQGAADFARRVSEKPYGTVVALEVLDDKKVDGRRRVGLALWEPERHVTELQLWPLFGWAEPADESRSRFVLVDLWLFWLYKHERTGATNRYSILRFIAWETGVGTLTEEPGS